MRTIIGLGHYSRTGKDTFANALIAELSKRGITAKKLPFAWSLKEVCHKLYGWAGVREPEFYDQPENEHYRDIITPALGMTPVELWVKFGTPAVRNQVFDGTWIEYVLQTDHGVDVLIIPDVRFPNETRRIHECGGHLTKVVRPGYGPRLTVADLALVKYRGWDNVIGETGGIPPLQEWAYTYARMIANGTWNTWPMRQPEEIEAAYAIEKMPSDEELRAVYQKAGLVFEEVAWT